MRSGWTKPRSERRPERRARCRPGSESLESRIVLTVTELSNIYGNLVTDVSTDAPTPFGVQFSGQRSSGGLGVRVSWVGDVDNDGFQDFAVAEPIVTTVDAPPLVSQGASRVYLVFGSRTTSGTSNWLNSLPSDRAGGLNAPADTVPTSIGGTNFTTAGQNNYVTGDAGFDFDGVVFNTSLSASRLGESIAPLGDIDGDGFDDFIIGSPGAPDLANNALGGRAYIVFGGASLRAVTSPFDLNIPVEDNSTIPAAQQAIRVTTLLYRNTLAAAATPVRGENLGASVAGVGNAFGGSRPDVLVGDPLANVIGATIATTNIDGGAAFLISGNTVPNARTLNDPANRRIIMDDILTVADADRTTLEAVAFLGTRAFENAGFAVGIGGDVDRTTGLHNEILIGAPGFDAPGATAAGRAYMVYGDADLFTLRQTTPVANTFAITLNRLNPDPAVTPVAANVVPGAIFQGSVTNGQSGFSVTSAGLFNDDNFAEILIGSPGVTNSAGEVTMVYGRANNTTPGRIAGLYTLNTLTPGTGAATAPSFTNFEGEAGSQAGYSVSFSAPTLASPATRNSILIGAPTYDTNDRGRAYLIPGENALGATFNLSDVGTAAASTGQKAFERTPNTTPNVTGENGNIFLGTSVSGMASLSTLNQRLSPSVDSDNIADVLIGAPNFRVKSSSATTNPQFFAPAFSGGLFMVQGGSAGGITPPPPPPPPPPPSVGGAVTRERTPRVEDSVTGPFGESLVPKSANLSKFAYRPLPRSVVQQQYIPDLEFRLRYTPGLSLSRNLSNSILPKNVMSRGVTTNGVKAFHYKSPVLPNPLL